MNAANALAFALFGSLMEFLPRAFPSWFPPTGADASSCRGLWLAVMGAVQITLGVGFLATAHAYPLVSRLFSRVPAREAGTMVLPQARITIR
jgi:hypothetical protein